MFGTKKRTFKELQVIILKALKQENLTIYQISKQTKLHFHVVKHQLILLKGQDYAEVVFEHGKFKLFSITKEGKKYLRKISK